MVTTHQVEDVRAKATAAGIGPAEIEQIVALVLQYGPGLYNAIVKLFHHDPKPPTPTPNPAS